jgi:hypothetical protein
MFDPDLLSTIRTKADLNETRAYPKDIVGTASKPTSRVITVEVVNIHSESLDDFGDRQGS